MTEYIRVSNWEEFCEMIEKVKEPNIGLNMVGGVVSFDKWTEHNFVVFALTDLADKTPYDELQHKLVDENTITLAACDESYNACKE